MKLLYDPTKTDLQTFMWDEHWNARFSEREELEAQIEKILKGRVPGTAKCPATKTSSTRRRKQNERQRD